MTECCLPPDSSRILIEEARKSVQSKKNKFVSMRIYPVEGIGSLFNGTFQFPMVPMKPIDDIIARCGHSKNYYLYELVGYGTKQCNWILDNLLEHDNIRASWSHEQIEDTGESGNGYMVTIQLHFISNGKTMSSLIYSRSKAFLLNNGKASKSSA